MDSISFIHKQRQKCDAVLNKDHLRDFRFPIYSKNVSLHARPPACLPASTPARMTARCERKAYSFILSL